MRIPATELASLFERLLALLVSCDARRYEQWEKLSWWEFTGAARKSLEFQRFLGDGMTRTLVAAQGDRMSARTGGLIVTADHARHGGREPVDRVLDGPTSEVWIDPWIDVSHGAPGVRLRNRRVTEIHCENGGSPRSIVAEVEQIK